MNAATEATLAELLRVAQAQNVNLEALNQLMAGRGSGGGAAGDLTRNIGAVSSGFSIIGAAASVVGSAFEMLGNVVGKVVDGIGNTIKGLKDFTLKAMEGTAKMSDLFAAFDKLPFFIGELFGFAKSLVSIVEKMTDDYIALTKAGAGFTGSITEMRSIAAGLSLSFSDLKEITMKNSQVFAAASGDVGTGVRRFANAMKELMGPDSTLKSDIYALGVTSKEAADYMTTMIQVNQVNFKNGQITGSQLAVQTKEYIENLDQLSRLTGVHRDQLNAMVKKQEDDTLFVNFRDQQSKATQELIRGTLAFAESMGMTQKDIDNVLKPMMRGVPATATTALSDFALATNYTSIEFAATIQKLMKSTKPYPEAMAEIQAGFKTVASGATVVANRFGEALGGLPSYQKIMSQSMVAMDRRTSVSVEQLAKDQEAAKKNADQQKSLMNFHESMTAMGNNIQLGFAQMINVVTPDLLKAGTALGEGLGSFVNSALKWFTKNYASIKEGWDTTVNVFKTEILPRLQKIGAWFGETFRQLSGVENWSQFWTVLKDRSRTGFNDLWESLKPIWYNDVKPVIVGVFRTLQSILEPLIKRLFYRLGAEMVDGINNALPKMFQNESPESRARARQVQESQFSVEDASAALKDAKRLPSGIMSPERMAELEKELKEARASRDRAWEEYRRGGGKELGNMPTPRANGGSLNPGSYLVGERGPEVMNVGASGDFTSNDNLGAALNRLVNEKPTSVAIEELNNTMKQLLSYSASTSENTRRTIGAIAKISGDMMPTI